MQDTEIGRCYLERKALRLPCSIFATRLFSERVGGKGLIFLKVSGASLSFSRHIFFNVGHCMAPCWAALWGS